MATTPAYFGEPSSASGIVVADLTVSFPGQPPVLDALSLEVSPGEIVALVGASGCGKSTLLRTIANLAVPASGEIRFSSGAPSQRSSDLSFVFQEATLLPWRTVHENIRLPLELGRFKSEQRTGDIVAQTRQLVGLSESDGKKYPRELSGGMRMRTSIARALVTDPNILLLDEPFAALDDLLRSKLNDLILELWLIRQRTILFVTHNIAEAVYLSHRIVILGNGKASSVVENELDWPRNAAQKSTTQFAALYGRVSQKLAEASRA